MRQVAEVRGARSHPLQVVDVITVVFPLQKFRRAALQKYPKLQAELFFASRRRILIDLAAVHGGAPVC